MHTTDKIARSPAQALAHTIRGGLQAGQMGAVFARPGTGKSALIVQIALDALLRGSNVLHVSLDHAQPHVRTYYDEMLHELVGSVDRATALSIERHRVIHSCLGRPFLPADLLSLLETLDRVMEFRPSMIILDGLEAATLDVAGWEGAAKGAHARLWLSVRTHRDHGPRPEDLAVSFTTALALEPSDGHVTVAVLRQGGHAPASGPTMELDRSSLLIQTEVGGGAGPSILAPEACTLYHTGAEGAESCFGELAEKYGMHEISFTSDGMEQFRVRGRTVLSERELAAGDVSLLYVSRRLHRQWTGEQHVRRVLQLLWQVVSHADQVFVVGSIQEDGTVTGGTGWSVELARRWRKEVWVYDQESNQWHSWDGKSWVQGEPTIRSTRFAGTGTTRHLSAEGKAAVEALFTRSFGR